MWKWFSQRIFGLTGVWSPRKVSVAGTTDVLKPGHHRGSSPKGTNSYNGGGDNDELEKRLRIIIYDNGITHLPGQSAYSS